MGGKLQEIVFCKLWVFYSVCFEAAGGKRQLHHDSMFPFFSLSISWSCEWNGLNLQRCQTYNQSRQETSYETVSITKTNQTNIHVSIFLVLYYNWPLSGDVCLAGSLSPLFVPKKALTNEPLTHTHTHTRAQQKPNQRALNEAWTAGAEKEPAAAERQKHSSLCSARFLTKTKTSQRQTPPICILTRQWRRRPWLMFGNTTLLRSESLCCHSSK